MTSIIETRIRKRLDRRLRRYAYKTEYYKAALGNDSGVIVAPLMSGYVYVTDFAGQVHTVYNGNVTPTSADALGTLVKVGTYEDNPRLLRIIGMFNPYAQQTTPDVSVNHASLEWPSPNTVYIYDPAIIPANVTADNVTMTVTIHPFILRMLTGKGRQILKQTLNMASYIPATSGAWALISFSQTTGLPVVTVGDLVSTPELLPLADNPATPTGCVARAAVALFAGQTAIMQNATQNQIRILRWDYDVGDVLESELHFYDDLPIGDEDVAYPGTNQHPSRGDHVHPAEFTGHNHYVWAWTGDGATTNFDLPDYAMELEFATDNALFVDPSEAQLSDDGLQVVFGAAPVAGHLVTANYIPIQV